MRFVRKYITRRAVAATLRNAIESIPPAQHWDGWGEHVGKYLDRDISLPRH
jgi:hypothetical protein